ncbi:MAG TPA: hypothetical protein PKI14_20180, partial [Fervidobacterium sp.]|nr:hypothetical protein [Fervidobacterium sp.]
IEASVSAIEEDVDDHGNRLLTVENAVVNVLPGQIALKADASEVYKKGEIDTKLGQKADNATVSELTTRITSAEQTLDAHAGAIAQKAERTEVYTKTETDAKLGTKVDTTTYINKVGELETSIEGITGRVSNTETNIDNLTGEVNSIKEDVSQLEITAEGIQSTVASLDAKVDGIEIGGRNYFPLTELDARYATELNVDVGNGIISGTTSWMIAWKNKILEPNQEYTISVKQIINENPDFPDFVRFRLYNVKADQYYPTKDIYSNSTYTFETGSEDEYTLLFYVVWGSEQANFSIEKLKLEKGNKATDWTPAPEDVKAEINTVASQVTQLADRY